VCMLEDMERRSMRPAQVVTGLTEDWEEMQCRLVNMLIEENQKEYSLW